MLQAQAYNTGEPPHSDVPADWSILTLDLNLKDFDEARMNLILSMHMLI